MTVLVLRPFVASFVLVERLVQFPVQPLELDLEPAAYVSAMVQAGPGLSSWMDQQQYSKSLLPLPASLTSELLWKT